MDLGEQALRFALQPVGERLDVIGAAERVDHLRDTRLVRDDLLGPQGQADGLLGRERQRFVQ